MTVAHRESLEGSGVSHSLVEHLDGGEQLGPGRTRAPWYRCLRTLVVRTGRTYRTFAADGLAKRAS